MIIAIHPDPHERRWTSIPGAIAVGQVNCTPHSAYTTPDKKARILADYDSRPTANIVQAMRDVDRMSDPQTSIVGGIFRTAA